MSFYSALFTWCSIETQTIDKVFIFLLLKEYIFLFQITYYIGPGHLFPVLIWLHSGDFMTGSAQVHPGQVLATKGIVVVTFNYRLGAFGEWRLKEAFFLY